MANFRSGDLVQGQPLGQLRKRYDLTADDQVLDPSGYAYLELTSDNATAANRTFTILPGQIIGHELVLELISGSSYTCQYADSGIAKLADAWEPLQYETLSLMWNGTYWVETARSSSASSSEVTLATPSITNLGVQRTALGVYDFAVDGGTGAIAISAAIPDNAIIQRVDYEVITTFTSPTSDAATIALSINSANDLVTAVDIADSGSPFDAGAPVVTAVTGATAAFVKLTAARQVTLTIGVEDVTAGKMRVYVQYVLSE